jgi:hypothetical protein
MGRLATATLSTIQKELKAPKSQYNSFGKYNYRNCEDILEAVKPINLKYRALVLLSDEIITISERYYVKATATFVDVVTGENVSVTAFAREEETKKGMDGSQITGTASSYARKYALNGLFCIDDTKDADTDEYKKNQNAAEAPKQPKIAKSLRQMLIDRLNEKGMDIAEYAREKGLDANTTPVRFEELLKELG